MADEEDVEVVLVKASSPDKAHNERLLQTLEARLESAGLGEVVGTVCMDEPTVTLLLEVAPALAVHAESLVIPQVQALLQRLGLTEHITVELAQDAEDDDDEGWDEAIEELPEEAPTDIVPPDEEPTP